MFSAIQTEAAPGPTPRLLAPAGACFRLDGEIGRRLETLVRRWLLPAPYAYPAMLEMLRRRDRKPLQPLPPWAGEYAGTYLTYATEIWRLTGDEELEKQLRAFVGELVSLQDDDGYLGPWPRGARFAAEAPNCSSTPWDGWGHYHLLLGLLLWQESTQDARALRAARLIGDMLCLRFLHGPGRLHDCGEMAVNLAPVHALTLLHQATGERRYLALALKIAGEFARPGGGNYLQAASAGQSFAQSPLPRWESLHTLMALPKLYWATGKQAYADAFEHWWWSLLEGERYNSGGFCAGGTATGDLYHGGSTESGGTVAWMAMSVEMLKLSGDSRVADELELSTFNSGLSALNYSGSWTESGMPDNAPRAIGLLGEWAVMEGDGGLTLNYYGAGEIEAGLPDGSSIKLQQKTDYPRDGRVLIRLDLERPRSFPLRLRIPAWSRQTGITVNGMTAEKAPTPGEYLRIEREWRSGDRIEIEFDFTPHYRAGRRIDTLDWGTDWLCFGPGPLKGTSTVGDSDAQFKIQPNMDGLRGIPTGVAFDGVIQAARRVRSDNGLLNFREIAPQVKGTPAVVGFTTVESRQTATLSVAFAADRQIRWWVNGRKVFDNFGAAGAVDFTERTHRLELPLIRGYNTVSFCLAGGQTRGAWLSLGRGALPPKLHIAPEMDTDETPMVPLWRASVYRGPLLLAYDSRFNPPCWDETGPPPLDPAQLQLWPTPETAPGWPPPWLLLETESETGTLRLCDYASATAAGPECRSWLPVHFVQEPETRFSRENPLRTFRPETGEPSPHRKQSRVSQDRLSF